VVEAGFRARTSTSDQGQALHAAPSQLRQTQHQHRDSDEKLQSRKSLIKFLNALSGCSCQGHARNCKLKLADASDPSMVSANID
jgi:hypothetical protein